MRVPALGLMCLVACGSDPTPAPTCAGDAPPGTRCVREVRGAVEDLAGHPLAGLGTSVCGRACYGGTTDPSGAYRVTIGAFVDLSRDVVHVDGRPDHADMYARLADGAEASVEVTRMRAPALPADGAALPPDGAGGQVTSGPLTLTVPQGATLTLAFADAIAGPFGRLVRVTRVGADAAPDFARQANVSALYALAPAGAVSSAKLAVHLANDAGLANGAAIELLTLEDDAISAPLEAGTLRVAASGHVSPDGRAIDSDPGEGITKITWLGVRPK